MKVDEYTVKHWIEKEIWTHLDWKMHRDRLAKIASLLEGPGMQQYLDVGCALGHTTARLKELCGGTWVAIDTSPAAISKARELFPFEKAGIHFYYSDPNEYLDVGQYDGVVCSEVIEHVENDQALADYLIRSTRKTLVVTTPAREIKDPGHLRLYDEEMLAELFSGHDATIERDDHFFYLTLRIPEIGDAPQKDPRPTTRGRKRSAAYGALRASANRGNSRLREKTGQLHKKWSLPPIMGKKGRFKERCEAFASDQILCTKEKCYAA